MLCSVTTLPGGAMQANTTPKGDFPQMYREFVQEFPYDNACAERLLGAFEVDETFIGEVPGRRS
jgi:hypothetical protein